MIVPKHRSSKARTRKRRMFYKLVAGSHSTCAQCGSPKRPHMICASCGYYKGRQVLSVTAEK